MSAREKIPRRGRPGGGRKQAGPRAAGQGRAAAGRGRVPAGHIVWILGHARSGSSWLAKMMNDLPQHKMWNEPLVGRLFGEFYAEKDGDLRGKSFFLAPDYREVWLRGIRGFMLDGVAARFPRLGQDGWVVIKEPHGSLGSPHLLGALPESRMIFLVRDPRDTVASAIDGQRQEGWTTGGPRYRKLGLPKPTKAAETDPDRYAKHRAKRLVIQVGGAHEAYKTHPGPKVLVRYEELRADTLAQMRRIYSTLEIPVDDETLAGVVAAHDWSNLPDEEKGEGKKARKATPGGWQEDLTPQQIAVVEKITRPILKAFYRDPGPSRAAGA